MQDLWLTYVACVEDAVDAGELAMQLGIEVTMGIGDYAYAHLVSATLRYP
jgi:hypothetical protein